MMKVSLKGALDIIESEGLVPAPYLDSVGVWTIYVGHTKMAGGIDPETMPRGMPSNMDAAIKEALRVFQEDLAKYEARVNDAIKVPLKQHEFDALVSFDLNTGGIYKAKLTKAINRGQPDAARHFLGWLRPPEIAGRRRHEMHLFQTGNYDQNGDTIPVYSVDENGKLRGLHSTMTGVEVAKLLKVEEPKEPGFVSVLVTLLTSFLKGLKK